MGTVLDPKDAKVTQTGIVGTRGRLSQPLEAQVGSQRIVCPGLEANNLDCLCHQVNIKGKMR